VSARAPLGAAVRGLELASECVSVLWRRLSQLCVAGQSELCSYAAECRQPAAVVVWTLRGCLAASCCCRCHYRSVTLVACVTLVQSLTARLSGGIRGQPGALVVDLRARDFCDNFSAKCVAAVRGGWAVSVAAGLAGRSSAHLAPHGQRLKARA